MNLPPELEIEMKVHTISDFRSGLDIEKRDEALRSSKRVSILEYSDTLEKALRILAYCIRYINARIKKYKPPSRSTRSVDRTIAPPTRQEKANAMEYFIKKSQQEYYNAELTALRNHKRLPDKTKLEPLKPILDSRGVMRVGGRLDRADAKYEMKHPAIIPKGSRLAWLLMDFSHRVNHHGGIQLMMQHIAKNTGFLSSGMS